MSGKLGKVDEIFLELVLPPPENGLEQLYSALAVKGVVAGPLNPKHQPLILQLFLEGPTYHVYRLWWDRKPRAQLRIAATKMLADNALVPLMQKWEYTHTYELDKTLDLIVIKVMEKDELLEMLAKPMIEEQTRAWVRRLILDFTNTKGEAEGAAILEDARKMIENDRTKKLIVWHNSPERFEA